MARDRFGRQKRLAGAALHSLAGGLRSASYRLLPSLRLIDKGFSDIGPAEFGGLDMLVDGESGIIDGQLEGIYERHLFTSTCINYISERVAMVPLQFTSKSTRAGSEESEPADDHEIARAFNWWNPKQSDFEAWEWVTAWWLIAGRAYVAKVDSDDPDRPFELWPLYTPGVTVMRHPRLGVVAYKYRVRGEEKVFLPEEMLVFGSFTTNERFGGMGKLYAGRKEVVTDLRARQWNDELLKKGVHVSGTLETDEEVPDEDAERIRAAFEEKYGGSNRSGRIAVLSEGLKFKPTTFAHKDIFWAEQLRMTKEDISLAFGLPEEILGQKSANHAALKEKRRIFWEDTIKALTKRFDSVLNSTFLPAIDPALHVEHDYSNVEALQPDRNEQYKAAATAVQAGLLTINEIRQEWKREPVDGGDVTLIGRGLVPLNQTGTAERDSERAALEATAHKTVSKAEGEYLRAMDALREQTEVRLQSVVRSTLRETEGKVLDILAKDATETALAEVDQVMFVESGKAMRAKADSTLQRAMEKSGGNVNAAVGIEGAFSLRNTRAEALLRKQGTMIEGIGRRQGTELRKLLSEGLAEGRSETGLRDIVSDYFRGERSNALTIARTETTRAVNGAANEAMVRARKDHGINVLSEWRTTGDELVRPTDPNGEFDHQAAQGQQIDPDQQLFTVSGEHLEYPGDPNGSPGNTINCRCGVLPVVVKSADANGNGHGSRLTAEQLAALSTPSTGADL